MGQTPGRGAWIPPPLRPLTRSYSVFRGTLVSLSFFQFASWGRHRLFIFSTSPSHCSAPGGPPAPHQPELLNCCCIPAEGAFEVQIGACGLSASASVLGTKERPGQAPPSPLEPAEGPESASHYHHKSLVCMSMVLPSRHPRTAAPGLGLGGPGQIWGRGETRSKYLGERQRYGEKQRDSERPE